MSRARLQQRLAEMTLELVRIPSVTGNERELAHHLERWALSQPGLGRDDVIRHGDSLLVGQPDGRRPCVALVGPIDTVPPVQGDPEPGIDGDRIVGRGSSDMKGGIAVMQALYEDLNLDALPFALLLVLYDAEEGPYDQSGLGPLLDEIEMLQQIDLAIALEPTDNSLQLGCLGAIHAGITFRGRAAHSGRPWEGDNAIHKGGAFLSRLAERRVRTASVGRLPFRESMSVTLASGGSARNVVPDRFELNLNVRFAATADIPAAIEAAKREVRELAAGAEVDFRDVAPPGPVPIENPILDHLRRLGELRVEPKEAWTDVARLAAHGIDAVNFGPGQGNQAHQAGEWASSETLVTAYEILTRTLSTPLA
jgi:succinyl-diaminopimelate desuccinylase